MGHSALRFGICGVALLVAGDPSLAVDAQLEESPMQEHRPAAAFVNDAAEARTHAGQLVAVQGTARNAKLGAAVVGADLVVYCPAIGSWPAPLRDRQVQVQGRLEQSADFVAAKGETSAGTDGPVWVLQDCRLDTR